MPPKTTLSVHTLEVLDLAGRGDGVCRLPDGAVVLVPGAVPGDRIEVALEPVRAGVLRGRIVQLVAPSPDRTTPPCPVAARCGGCTWLHVSLPRQRASKASLASRAISVLPADREPASDRTASGRKAAPDAEPTTALRPTQVGDAPLLGWRRRARLHMRRQGDVLTIGLLQSQSDALVAISSCAQLEPEISAWLPRWRRDLEPWLERGELLLTRGVGGMVVHVQGIGRRRDETGSAETGSAETGSAETGSAETGSVESADDRALQAMLRGWLERPVAAGAPMQGANATLGDRRVRIGDQLVWLMDDPTNGADATGSFASAAGFSQASSRGNASIRHAVGAALQALIARRGSRFSWGDELYAGSGNLTPILAQAAEQVRSVEFDADAVARAEAARSNWSAAIEALGGSELRVGDAGKADLQGGENAVWLLDPGRPGAADVVARAIAAQPGALVYVSCAPDTLRRDLVALAAAGWTGIAAFWIDSMPATPHLEIVVAAVPPRLDADRAHC